MKFMLPEAIKDLVLARNKLRERYSESELTFTLDGKLVGDIGEAVASEIFGLKLDAQEGIDGYAPDGRTVQVKASGTGRGPLFRPVLVRAEHLLFMHLDFENCTGEVVYNGPEAPVIAHLVDDESWSGQRPVSMTRIRAAAASLNPEKMLPPV